MQKLSIRKISVLGLVLMAASAVTAAVLPKSDNKLDKFAAGSLTLDSGAGASNPSSVTCAVDTGVNQITAACNHSTGAGTESTGGGEELNSTSVSSLHGNPPAGDGGVGADNTSDAS